MDPPQQALSMDEHENALVICSPADMDGQASATKDCHFSSRAFPDFANTLEL